MAEKLNVEYFDWIYQLINGDFHGLSYRKLLLHLNSIVFQSEIPMDENRAGDGVNLRYRFGYERSYDAALIACYLDCKPCSVLEMMAALSLRCEETIMQNPNFGDRTAEWFWGMIDSLGLEEMYDSNYDAVYVENVIFRFINHEYERNGKGGLFTIENECRDMRKIEIWWQMNWYLGSIVMKGEY